MEYNLGTARGRIVIDAAGATASVGALGAVTDETGRKLSRAGGAVSRVGKMFMGFGVALVAGLGLAVKTSADFNASMNKMRGLVGLSAREVSFLRDGVLSLAGQTGKAPLELSKALFMITSAGFRGKAALDVLRESAKAAAAGLGDTAVIGDTVAAAVNAFGAKNLSASEAVDVLTNAVRLGKVEAATLAPVLGRVMPVAGALGVSFNDVGAAIASMTRTGMNAAQAATRLTGVFAVLIKPSAGAVKALDSVGLTAEGLRNDLKTIGLDKTILLITHAFHGNISEIGKVFPALRGLQAVLSLTGANAKKDTGIFHEMAHSTGIADRAFRDVTTTTDFKFNKALASLKTALVRVGDALEPTVGKLASYVAKAADAFSKLSPGTQDAIIKIAGIIGLAAILVGTLGMLSGSLLQIVGAFRELKAGIAIIKEITVVQWLWNIATAANPYVLIIMAIIALGVAFWQLYEHCKPFRNFIDGIGRWFRRAWDVVFNTMKGVVAWFVNSWHTIQDDAGKAVKWIIGAWNGLVDWFVKLPGVIGHWFQRTFSAESFHALGMKIHQGLIALFTVWIPKAASALGHAFVVLFTSVIPNAAIALGKLIITWVPRVLKFQFYTLPQLLLKTLWHVASLLWQGFVDGLKLAWKLVVFFFTRLPTLILRFFLRANNWLISVGRNIIHGLITGISDAVKGIWSFIRGLINRVIAFFKGLLGISSPSSVFASIGRDIITGLVNGLKAAWSVVYNWFAGMAARILRGFARCGTWLYQAGRNIIHGLSQGISSFWGGLVGWISGIGGRLLGAVHGSINWLFDVGKNIIQGLWNGMKSVWHGATGWLSSLASLIPAIKGPIAKDRKLLVETGGAIMDGLASGLASGFAKSVIPTLAGMSRSIQVHPPTIPFTAVGSSSVSGRIPPYTAAGDHFSIGSVVIPAKDLAEMKNVTDFLARIKVEARKKVGTP